MRIVPIVIGHLSGDLLDLRLLEQLVPGGCFAFSEGSPIWSCVDCGTALEGKDFQFEESDSANMRNYHTTVNAIFENLVPLSEHEFNRLQGKRLLKGFTRSYFKNSTSIIEFVPTEGGFKIQIKQNGSNRTVENEHLSEKWFLQMMTFVRAQNVENDHDGGCCGEIAIGGDSGLEKFSILLSEPTSDSRSIQVLRV